MTKQEFLVEISDVLQLDEIPSVDFALTDEYWDSVAQMAVMAFFGKSFGLQVSFEDLVQVSSVSDLLDLAKDHLSE